MTIEAYRYVRTERTAPDGTVTHERILSTDPVQTFPTLYAATLWTGTFTHCREVAIVVDGTVAYYA